MLRHAGASLAYVGALALLAILGVHLWDELPAGERRARRQSRAGAWPPARTRLLPSASSICLKKQRLTKSSGIPKAAARTSCAGPPDATQSEKPVAELEIYRPGGEFGASGPSIAEIAARMDRRRHARTGSGWRYRQQIRPGDAASPSGERRDACLGFLKRLDDPTLRISGWSCQGDDLPARRAAIGCMLNRLILLTAGNEPKLAELFARAELRRAAAPPHRHQPARRTG